MVQEGLGPRIIAEMRCETTAGRGVPAYSDCSGPDIAVERIPIRGSRPEIIGV